MQTTAPAPAYDEAVPRKPMKNRLYRMGDVPYLAAQMEAEVTDKKVAEAIREFLTDYGSRHLAAAQAAWAELEAAAPEGKDPTKEQVSAFLVKYGREFKEGNR